MKKMVLATFLICTLLFSSCGASSEVVFYEELNAVSVGMASAGVGESSGGNYSFKIAENAEFIESDTVKTVSAYGYTLEMKQFATKTNLGQRYQEELYQSDNFMVFLNKETQELVGIRSYYLETPIFRLENASTEQDLIDGARNIAKEYIDVEDYTFKIVPKEAPEPGVTSGYRGDEYTFIKQLSGVDTAERFIVSITPDGAVGNIRHEAIGQFEDFEGVTLDEALINRALENALSAALPRSDGRIDVQGYDYYLLNDGGTLLLYLSMSSTSTPIDEARTTDPANPVYRESYKVNIGTVAVVPIAEIVTK